MRYCGRSSHGHEIGLDYYNGLIYMCLYVFILRVYVLMCLSQSQIVLKNNKIMNVKLIIKYTRTILYTRAVVMKTVNMLKFYSNFENKSET